MMLGRRLAAMAGVVTLVLALVACKEYFSARGRWNPADDRYDSQTDPANSGAAIPVAPSDLVAAVADTQEAVNLTWRDNATHETSYEVLRRVQGDPEFTVVVPDLAPDATSYTDSAVTGGATYEYAVRARNAAGPSADSNVAVVTVGIGLTITSSVGAATSHSPIPVTFTFAKAVSGFALSDIQVEGGVPSGLTGSDTIVFEATVAPSADPVTVVVRVAANAAFSAGGEGNAPARLSVIYDTVAPTGSLAVNSGDLYSRSPDVTVTVTADDGTGSGVAEMLLSNDSALTAGTWEPYSATRQWTLAGGDGAKTIYAKVRDAAGNVSALLTDSIVLDTTPPGTPSGQPDLSAADDSGSSGSDNITNVTTGLTFSGTGADSSVGVVVVLFSSVDGQVGTATPNGAGQWTMDVTLSANAVHTIYAKCRDLAGNLSAPSPTLAVTVDTTPPAAVTLLRPYQGENTGTNKKPTFRWTAAAETVTYHLQVNDSADFGASLPLEVEETAAAGTSYTPGIALPAVSMPTQPVGTRYWWRVQATDTAGNVGPWTTTPSRYVNVGRFDKDFNGDGFSDVLIGSWGTSNGTAWLYLGGTSMNSAADLQFTGENDSDAFGVSVAFAGDVNADGYQDIIIGANHYPADANAGRAYLFLGGSTPNAVADLTFDPPVSGLYGMVAAAGDLNGDGYGDVVVGAPWTGNYGRAYVYLGGTPMDATADATFTGNAYDNLGNTVASAGDLNADGYDDLLLGATQEYGGGAGRVDVHYGGAPFVASGAAVSLYGEASGDLFGFGAGRGDVNGDGYPDILVGALRNAAGGTDAGRAYLYLGGPGMDGVADLVFPHAAAGAHDIYGTNAMVGDVNADGYDDFLIGAGGVPAVYLYYGAAVPDSTADLTFTGTTASGFGYTLAGVGDVNGDGVPDLVIGAQNTDPTNAGAAYVYLGSPLDAAADVDLSRPGAYWLFGCSVD